MNEKKFISEKIQKQDFKIRILFEKNEKLQTEANELEKEVQELKKEIEELKNPNIKSKGTWQNLW